MKELADEIDAKYLGDGLARRFTGHLLKPAYSDEEIYEGTTSTTTVILALIAKLLAVQKHEESSKAIETLVES